MHRKENRGEEKETIPLNLILSYVGEIKEPTTTSTIPVSTSFSVANAEANEESKKIIGESNKFHISRKTINLMSSTSTTPYDVLDHCFGAKFSNALLNEIESFYPMLNKGQIENRNSISFMNQLVSSQVRNDKSMFLTKELIRDKPILASFVQSVKQEIFSKFKSLTQRTSIQLALYKGDGTSGYVKHLDASITKGEHRFITAVYYLNNSWKEEYGGGLKIFADNTEEIITPFLDRLVVFRSDLLYHEVLPSFQNKDRVALTIWFYANFEPSNLQQTLTHDVPPLPASTTSSLSQKTIFVSIASYRDLELSHTISSLFESAQFPSRIFVGILQQISTEEAITIPVQFKDQIRILTIHSKHSTGPCNARSIIFNLYRKEDYFLQIDSHMQFRRHWDSFLTQHCLNDHTVITSYPPGYQLPCRNVEMIDSAIMISPTKFDENGMLRQTGKIFNNSSSEHVIPCHYPLLAAGFLFSKASILSIICNTEFANLHGLFFGEEVYLSALLFSHGYLFYTPTTTVLWHLWKRNTHTFRENEFIDLKKTMHIASLKHIKDITTARVVSPFFGTVRTISDFEKALNVSFEHEQVHSQNEYCKENELKNKLALLME